MSGYPGMGLQGTLSPPNDLGPGGSGWENFLGVCAQTWPVKEDPAPSPDAPWWAQRVLQLSSCSPDLDGKSLPNLGNLKPTPSLETCTKVVVSEPTGLICPRTQPQIQL